jgi:RNA recognition motif-containing protein
VELADKSMVDDLKALDMQIFCLGEPLHIRKLNEETVHTNIQSAAITLAALQNLTTGVDASLNLTSGSLKTVAASNVIKVSNVFEREFELTPELYEELKEDMEDEFAKIPHLKRIKIVRNGEERLGAEVGCVFVEFRDKRSAEAALKKIKGRIYDGREIKVSYVEEKLYFKELYIE